MAIGANFAVGSESLTVTSAVGITPGAYLFVGITATTGEYELVTDVTGTALEVKRNVKPPCVTWGRSGKGAHKNTPAAATLDTQQTAFKLAIPTTAVGTDNGGAQANNHFNLPGHGLVAGDAVVYRAGGGTAITNLVDGTTYYVFDVDGNDFQVSATAGTTPLNPAVTDAAQGNSQQYFQRMNVHVLAPAGSSNMISTSMRAVVELSPREPIMWAPVAPVLSPSPHYVDLRVTMPYSLAEFNVPSVTEPFKRAIARVAGTTVDKIVLSFPEQRRAATDTLLVDVRINADSAAEARSILATLGADPDTLECAATCRAALLVRLNKELRAEGLREALAIEIRGASVVATKKKGDDNMLLLLLLLLLIPVGAAVYWCCKQEPVAPVGQPQPYPVLEMSPQPVMMAPMPMVEMSPQPVMMAPMGMQPPMPPPPQPMQYGM